MEDNEVTVISTIWDAPGSSGLKDVWIAERRRNDRNLKGKLVDHQWIDGRTCPALRAALAELARLPAMRFGSPGDIGMTGLAFDVPLTVLRGPPGKEGGGGIQLSRAEFIGPLPEWHGRMERAVKACWRDAPVVIPGVEIRELLTNDAEAEAWMR